LLLDIGTIMESGIIIAEFLKLNGKLPKSITLLTKLIAKKEPKGLDDLVHRMHEKWFDKINCLDCAMCCKKLSPGIKHADVERLAQHLRIKPSALAEQHLEIDSDGEYVFKSSPCPFLCSDNLCQVYAARPKACREYPHTDRRRFGQIADLTAKNSKVCPGAFHIMAELASYLKLQ
jgi:uncharacterized protein